MAERILIIQTAFLGDAILTLPMIQKLKEQNPDYSLDVLTIPSTAQIFQNSPSVNSVYIMEKRGEHKSIFALFKFAKKLKKNKYSKIYSPHRSFRSSLIVAMLRVRESFGFDNSALKYVYKNLIPYKINDHEVKRNLSLINFDTDNEKWKVLPILTLNNSSKVADLKLKFENKKIIAVAPGSVWETKKYPEENFKKVIELAVDAGFSVCLIGGDDDKQLCKRIAFSFTSEVYSAAGDLSIIESIELLKNCLALICNDSAPTHMGMCADIPVVAIYCSTVPQFGFYPYNSKSKSVGVSSLKCKPCGIHGHKDCPVSTFECGKSLEPEVIYKAFHQITN